MLWCNIMLWCLFLLLVRGCQPPDCDHPDCGSCGNACCTLEFAFDITTEQVFNLTCASLTAGGPDGEYVFVEKEDMRPYHYPSIEFLIRGVHMSPDHKSNETLNFLVMTSSQTKETLVKAFSNSEVLNTYCDGGQNYKNLVGFVKGLKQDFKQRTLSGCTAPHE